MHVDWAILRQNRLGGLTSRREPEKKSQKVSDSHRNDLSPLTQGLRYRAACDKSAVRQYGRCPSDSLASCYYCFAWQLTAFSTVAWLAESCNNVLNYTVAVHSDPGTPVSGVLTMWLTCCSWPLTRKWGWKTSVCTWRRQKLPRSLLGATSTKTFTSTTLTLSVALRSTVTQLVRSFVAYFCYSHAV